MRSPSLALALLLVLACRSSDESAAAPARSDARMQVQELDTARKSRRFEFTYEASIAEVPAGTKELRLWIPLPIATPDQAVENLAVESSHAARQADIEHGTGRSLCITSPGEPVHVRTTCTVTRYESHGGGRASPAALADALEADAMIPLDGKVAANAAAMKLSDDPFAAAHTLYEHTLERMRYDKPAGGAWGRGDAEWACDSRFGNCTDFHSYFMGLARARHIPARFEMGFPVPAGPESEGPVAGYHCWAYFWSEQHGWVPVDISEADKAPEKAGYYFGTLDENRVTMTGGRDVLLTPRPAKGALNFFVYPYAEADGVEVANVQRSFARRNLP